jgi:hypothetical protein
VQPAAEHLLHDWASIGNLLGINHVIIGGLLNVLCMKLCTALLHLYCCCSVAHD